jgi:hypothetical protein
MRAASTAALRAASTPTQATGTPGRHLGDREQRVEAARDRLGGGQRDADHRQGGVRRHHAGQRRREPGAGDDHPQPAQLGVARVVGTMSGSRWADITRTSWPIPRSDSSRSAASIAAMSDLEPHQDADLRSVDVHLRERRAGIGLGERLGRPLCRRGVSELLAHAAMSRRICAPGKLIIPAAAYAADRAAARSSPSAVTPTTRPPA